MTGMTDIHEMKARIVVFGVGGAGGNAVNNMITAGLQGVDFVVANTDAQALAMSKATRLIQLGTQVTAGLGAGSQPEFGTRRSRGGHRYDREGFNGAHMVFVTAARAAAPAPGLHPSSPGPRSSSASSRSARSPKPFYFEGQRRMRFAEAGIEELLKTATGDLSSRTRTVLELASEIPTFADAVPFADQVLYSGAACISDLIVKEGLINLDFADVLSVMRGEGQGHEWDGARLPARNAGSRPPWGPFPDPLIENPSIKRASGLIISITGGKDQNAVLKVD